MQRKAFLSSAIALSTIATRVSGGSPVEHNLQFSPRRMKSDVEYLWRTMLEIGPDPFRSSVRSAVEGVLNETLRGLGEPLTLSGFWLRVAKLFAHLNDGHVVIQHPEYKKRFTSNLVFFPIRLLIDPDSEQGFFVLSDQSARVPPASRIMRIGSHDWHDLRSLALQIGAGQTPVLHRYMAAYAVPLILYALDGPRTSYDVEYVERVGRERRTTVPFMRRPEIAHVPYSYRRIAEGRVALIDYRSCEDIPRFTTFLRSTFSDIRDNGVTALIIDIRRNGGGDSRLNDLLWSYVSDKPFSQFGRSQCRSNLFLKQIYGRSTYIDEYGSAAWNAHNGALIDSPAEKPRRHGDNPLRFGKPTFLLIGPSTFSSAMACATAAKDYGLATVLGEATAEPVNSTGDVFQVVAPETKLVGWFTTQMYFDPKNDASQSGVLPDVLVRTTLEDLRLGRDPVLRRALELARKHV